MIGMMVIDVFPSSIQILPHLFLWSELQINILARTPTTHNSQPQKPTISPLTMAAADALMTTFPWCYDHDIAPRESLSPLLCNTSVGNFLLRLVLRRRPAYAIIRIPTISRQPWPPPMPR